MNTAVLMKTLRKDWVLVALLAGVVVTGVLVHRQQSTDTQVAAAATVETAAEVSSPEVRLISSRPSESQRAQDIIERYQREIQAEPGSSDAPAKLHAMGNLCRQKLRDYKQAAQYYETLLHDYPEWEGIRTTYIGLLTCYDKLDDRGSLRRVCEDMMTRFAPDSQEYLYAKDRLSR